MFPMGSSDGLDPQVPAILDDTQPDSQPDNPDTTPQPDDTDTQPDDQNGSSFTMTELQAKLEAQQVEARRMLNKAKLLGNRDAIKFGTAALLKASKSLDKIKKKTTTADEVQKDAERVDFYLKQADAAVN